MAAPPSRERAYRQALVKYLEDETFLDWQYYDDVHTVGDVPKGGVRVYGLFPNNNFVPGLAHSVRFVAQLRLLAGGVNEGSVQDELLDYTKWIDNLLGRLSTTGVTGTYSDVSVRKALMGIRMSERGAVFQIERSADNTGDVAISGRVVLEYEFNIEN